MYNNSKTFYELPMSEISSNREKRFYSPQFSEMATVAVKRLSWALNTSMVQAVNEIVSFLPQLVASSKICLACKDNTKCGSCVFNGSIVPKSAMSELVN